MLRVMSDSLMAADGWKVTLLGLLYNAELECIVDRHGIKLYQFAVDCQIYISISVADSYAAVCYVYNCKNGVKCKKRCPQL